MASKRGLEWSYRDITVSERGLLNPNICALAGNELIVTAAPRHCFLVGPGIASVIRQPSFSSEFVTALHAPASTSTQPPLWSAATKLTWTEMWRTGQTTGIRVQTRDSVNCIAFSDAGDLLAMGLGEYPLGTHEAHAAVQLFATADPTVELGHTVLTGSASDRIAFDSTNDLLVVTTGVRGQDRGYVFLLESPSLNVRDVAETDAFYCVAIFVHQDEDCVSLVYRDRIELRRFDAFQEIEWRWNIDETVGATFDANRKMIILSSGKIISPGVGEVGQLPNLPQCTGVAMLDAERVAGISSDGILRVWALKNGEME